MQAKVQQLQQLHQSMAEQVPQMRADAKQQQDAIRTICSKQARYKQQQQRLVEDLRENYFDPSVSAGAQLCAAACHPHLACEHPAACSCTVSPTVQIPLCA